MDTNNCAKTRISDLRLITGCLLINVLAMLSVSWFGKMYGKDILVWAGIDFGLVTVLFFVFATSLLLIFRMHASNDDSSVDRQEETANERQN